jgi:hypothetical protein
MNDQSTKVIVEAFKKEYLELLAKYPEVTVAEDKNRNLVCYAINHIDEATVGLQHNIQNYAY